MIFEGIGGRGGIGGTGGGGGGTIISGLDIGGIGGTGGGGGGKGILCTIGGGGGGATFFLVCEKAENDNNTQTINKFALKCFIIFFLV